MCCDRKWTIHQSSKLKSIPFSINHYASLALVCPASTEHSLKILQSCHEWFMSTEIDPDSDLRSPVPKFDLMQINAFGLSIIEPTERAFINALENKHLAEKLLSEVQTERVTCKCGMVLEPQENKELQEEIFRHHPRSGPARARAHHEPGARAQGFRRDWCHRPGCSPKRWLHSRR